MRLACCFSQSSLEDGSNQDCQICIAQKHRLRFANNCDMALSFRAVLLFVFVQSNLWYDCCQNGF